MVLYIKQQIKQIKVKTNKDLSLPVYQPSMVMDITRLKPSAIENEKCSTFEPEIYIPPNYVLQERLLGQLMEVANLNSVITQSTKAINPTNDKKGLEVRTGLLLYSTREQDMTNYVSPFLAFYGSSFSDVNKLHTRVMSTN